MGGFTTAIVALPLALAFGVASGAGAKAGLYSSIITGILSTLFGGTPAQINGPTGVMTIVLIELYERFGLEGLFAAMVVAGLFQIAIGVLRLGKYIHLIPHPVIVGFTNGVGCLIFIKMFSYFNTSPIVAFITISTMLLFPLLTKKIPASLIALIVGTVAGTYFLPTDALVGAIPAELPRFSLPSFPAKDVLFIIRSGFTLAMLGCIETLLSCVIVDELTKTKHNSNRELIGQGIGNTVAALFGALIGSGVIIRSVVNINAGGRTRLSGVLHGIFLLIITLKFNHLVSQIPLAVLGGILMGTAIKMVEYNTTKQMTYASKRAGTTIIVTTLLTVFTDLTVAVALGTLLSMFFFVVRMGEVYLKEYPVDCSDLSCKIRSYTIEGPLFFGVSHAITSKLEIETENADIVVLNLMNIPAMDSSGAISLKNIKQSLELNGKKLIFAGIKPNMVDMLNKLDVLKDEELEISVQRIGEVLEYAKGLAKA